METRGDQVNNADTTEREKEDETLIANTKSID